MAQSKRPTLAIHTYVIPFVGESSNFDESAGVVNVGICRFENKQVFLMHTELS